MAAKTTPGKTTPAPKKTAADKPAAGRNATPASKTAATRKATARQPAAPRKTTARPARSRRAKPKDTAGPGLFDVRDCAERSVDGAIERVPLAELELAVNPRKQMSREGLERLAGLMMRHGQFIPAIGRRVADDKVLLYAGQRRYRAAELSHELAGSDGYENLSPLAGLIVLLLDYEPTERDIRRIQASENNAREGLGMVDQQLQFEDCWKDRAGAADDERMALVCDDLGISPKKGHNLRRCMTLPMKIRGRVAERPGGDELSIGMANLLADMHEISPELVESVAERISSPELHSRALKDIGGFVHGTVVEDKNVYAVRIDDGALLDAHDEIERARPHVTDEHTASLEAIIAAHKKRNPVPGDKPEEMRGLHIELDALAKKAKAAAVKIRVDGPMRDRAGGGAFAWVHNRGDDFAAGVWVVDPRFLIECAVAAIEAGGTVALEETFFKGANIEDAEMTAARSADDERRKEERDRQRAAIDRNLGLGEDIRAGLMDPHGDQMGALRDVVVQLIAAMQPEVIAFGAGWTDRTHQQPVGDSTRYEPRATDVIVTAELERALRDPDPLRGIAMLMSRWAAAFMLDPDGVTKSKTLGSDRMGRRLREALPGDADQLRAALWTFMRPMLSPALLQANRDAFVSDERDQTVDLQAHRADSHLEELDLGDATAAAQ